MGRLIDADKVIDIKYIELMKHCIGLGNRKPYKRHGKLFYKPYRNYFCTRYDDEVWEYIRENGYADRGKIGRSGFVDYWLTRKGLDWLGEQLGIKIYNEED